MIQQNEGYFLPDMTSQTSANFFRIGAIALITSNAASSGISVANAVSTPRELFLISRI